MTATSHPMHVGPDRHPASRPPYERYGGTGPDNYERFFVPSIGAPFAADLLAAAALQEGERVLDVACGTGIVTRYAARQTGSSGHVAGLDLNPGMLAVAHSAVTPDLGIEWHHASAEAMPLPDGSFDIVLCQLALQFMQDRLAAVREMHRVLAPGGRLALSVVGPVPGLFAVMSSALVRHVDPRAGVFVDAVFSLGDAEELRALLTAAGFQHAAVRNYVKTLYLPPPQEFLWQYVNSTPLAEAAARAGEAKRAAFEREVISGWQDLVIDGRLVLQVRVLLATGRKQPGAPQA